MDLAAGEQGHQALMGRAFLMHFTMTYIGTTGTVILEGGRTLLERSLMTRARFPNSSHVSAKPRNELNSFGLRHARDGTS